MVFSSGAVNLACLNAPQTSLGLLLLSKYHVKVTLDIPLINAHSPLPTHQGEICCIFRTVTSTTMTPYQVWQWSWTSGVQCMCMFKSNKRFLNYTQELHLIHFLFKSPKHIIAFGQSLLKLLKLLRVHSQLQLGKR